MRHVRILVLCLVAAFAMSGTTLVVASPALAGGKCNQECKEKKEKEKQEAKEKQEKEKEEAELPGIYAVFSACPLNNPEVTFCIDAQTSGGKTGGQFTVGSITIPLSKPITLQGGMTSTGYHNEPELSGFIEPESSAETLVAPAAEGAGRVQEPDSATTILAGGVDGKLRERQEETRTWRHGDARTGGYTGA